MTVNANQLVGISLNEIVPKPNVGQLVAITLDELRAIKTMADQLVVITLDEGPRLGYYSPREVIGLKCFVPCLPHAVKRY